MHTFWTILKRYFLFVVLLVVGLLVIGGLVYLAGWLGGQGGGSGTIRVTPVDAQPPLPGTPLAPFAPLDPDLLPYLENYQPGYGAFPLNGVGADFQPVGAYLPRTGNTRFDLLPNTPLPTPLPYDTAAPSPPPTAIPTLTPLPPPADPSVPTAPAAGIIPVNQDCAPEGNPVPGLLTQRYHGFHPGIDLAAPLGSPVYATHSGVVTFADWSDIGYGYLVILQSGPYTTYYAHNTSFNVSVSQFVTKGSVLAWSGSTGNSTGPHVHYEVRVNDIPLDPLTFSNRGYVSC